MAAHLPRHAKVKGLSPTVVDGTGERELQKMFFLNLKVRSANDPKVRIHLVVCGKNEKKVCRLF